MRAWTNLVAAVGLTLFLACDSEPYREVSVDLTAKPALGGSTVTDGALATHAPVVRVSVAGMESPRDTYTGYSRLFDEVGRRMGMEVAFIQRQTYRETNDLLASGDLDVALLCTGGYLELDRSAPGAVEVLAVPIVKGAATFDALVIVPADRPTRELTDLAGKRFAYTDELSLSGHAYVVDALASAGHDPNHFFASTVYTHSHDRSIAAVARGLVDGASVHALIYEQHVASDPLLATRTRVIRRSPPFGMMPVVAATRLPPEVRARLREVLLGMQDDEAGRAVLLALHFDRFSVPVPGSFDTAARVVAGR